MSELASEVAALRRRVLRLERRVADALEVIMGVFGSMQEDLVELGECIPERAELDEEMADGSEKGK
jgi:hypothetical protein